MRVGPNEISFADPAALREIYTSDGFTKEESFYVGATRVRQPERREMKAHGVIRVPGQCFTKIICSASGRDLY